MLLGGELSDELLVCSSLSKPPGVSPGDEPVGTLGVMVISIFY